MSFKVLESVLRPLAYWYNQDNIEEVAVNRSGQVWLRLRGKRAYPWVMNKDNFLLYTAVIFLFLKHDKSVGLVLIGLWLVMNIGLIVALLGSMSAYLLPLSLLIIGGILYLISTR